MLSPTTAAWLQYMCQALLPLKVQTKQTKQSTWCQTTRTQQGTMCRVLQTPKAPCKGLRRGTACHTRWFRQGTVCQAFAAAQNEAEAAQARHRVPSPMITVRRNMSDTRARETLPTQPTAATHTTRAIAIPMTQPTVAKHITKVPAVPTNTAHGGNECDGSNATPHAPPTAVRRITRVIAVPTDAAHGCSNTTGAMAKAPHTAHGFQAY